MRHPTGWRWLATVGALACTTTLVAAEPTSAEREAQEIINRIRTTRPAESSSVEGVFKVFHGRRLHAVIPFRSEVVVTPTNWLAIYQTLPSTNAGPLQKLVITRRPDAADEYAFCGVTNQSSANARSATFAGSDFLAGDLGLDFLNWPGQRLLKKELRSSQSCYVLESITLATNSLPYARVVTWLDIDAVRDFGAPAIVHADAYDRRNKLLKEFGPKDFKKVDGQWHVEEMEMENVQTGNRTKIQFHFEPK